MITSGRFASTNYSGLLLRRARRRLIRRVFYTVGGGIAGGALFYVLGQYATILF